MPNHMRKPQAEPARLPNHRTDDHQHEDDDEEQLAEVHGLAFGWKALC